MICVHCGKELLYASKFCPYCGKRPIDETAEQPVTEEQPAVTEQSVEKQPIAYEQPAAERHAAAEQSAVADDPETLIRKKKRLIPRIIMIVAAVGVITVAAIFGGMYAKEQKEERFRTEMRHARRYLEDLKYDQAIVAYQAAIKIDPKNPKPYIGIADTYIAMGDYESARDYLRDGLDKTNDRKIDSYLDDIEEALKSRTKISGMVITEGTEFDTPGGTIEGATVSLIKAFGIPFSADTTTDENGRYEFNDLRPGKYNMVIKAADYLTVEQAVDVYPGQEESYNPVVMMISEDLSGEGTASGRIIDVLTGEGVSGITLKIRDGYNSTQGRAWGETKTDSQGYYTTPLLKAGYYTAEIIDNREGVTEPYLRSFFNIRIIGNRDTIQQNGSVSTKLIEGQVRIVLSWGAWPSDLDSHLFCSWENGVSHMNYYGNKNYYDAETYERIVDLDLDDTDYYGPETTTIYSNRAGDYVFGINNYSHGNQEELKNSQALVQVYLGNSVAPSYVFYVPQEDGYYWEVFRYDAEKERIIPLNRMYDNYYEREYMHY
ncbi:MAG: carboxypeptidase regulatory-like domain-containing protein [Lachnospiraceae bacterium]|nr:carboxypeptidase regulatory-like domain-containing protein [Lachnospiraceae bacterium]